VDENSSYGTVSRFAESGGMVDYRGANSRGSGRTTRYSRIHFILWGIYFLIYLLSMAVPAALANDENLE
jgi:hypothetical protein